MRVRLIGVYRHRKRLASGITKDFWTLRGVGPIKPLPGDETADFRPGTPAFMRSYQAMIAAPRLARTVGTLQQIVNGYQRSSSWSKLAPRTKSDYVKAIIRIENKWGSYPLDAIEDPKIRSRLLSWRDEMAVASPRQADAVFGVLRIILEWGRDRGLVAINHATRPKKVYRADRSDKLWLPENISALRAAAPDELLLAFELALGTGQRKGDLLKLEWNAYVDDTRRPGRKRLQLVQGKRKRKIDMPVPIALQALLDNTLRSAPTILARNGKPWGMVNFDHNWRKAILAAGLDGLHFHDLRGTACTLLAEAGATHAEIAAMMGWTVTTVHRMIETYAAMTATLSDSAVAKLESKAGESAE